MWVGQSIRNGQKESSVIAADKDEWTKPIDKHEQKEADVVSEFLNSEILRQDKKNEDPRYTSDSCVQIDH